MKGRREKEEQEYYRKRKETHKIFRNKEQMYIKNVIESIEKDQKKGREEEGKCINQ